MREEKEKRIFTAENAEGTEKNIVIIILFFVSLCLGGSIVLIDMLQ